VKYLQPYMKAIMALLGVVVTILSQHFGGAWWFPMITGALTVITTYQVPNTPKQ